MSLQAGKMNSPIEVQARAASVDDYNQPVLGDWETYLDLWAHVRGPTGMGVIRGSADGMNPAINAYSFRIRFRQDIDVSMRIVFGGEKYDIIDIKHDFEKREYTDIVARVGGGVDG